MEEMTYEEIVEIIAHLKAAMNVMGMSCPDNISSTTYAAILDAQNELNFTRLRLLGGDLDPPYHVAELVAQTEGEL